MMGQEETIRLLQECDAGVQMGIASIQEVLPYVKEEKFRQLLLGCRDKHEKLQEEIRQKLEVNRDERKEPNLMAKGMFWMKTKGKLVLDESDATIADLMTDGCNMGIKSLHRCLNQYAEADEYRRKTYGGYSFVSVKVRRCFITSEQGMRHRFFVSGQFSSRK